MGEEFVQGAPGGPAGGGPASWRVTDGAFTRDMLDWKDQLSVELQPWEVPGARDAFPRGEDSNSDDVFTHLPSDGSIAEGGTLRLPESEVGIVVRTDFSDEQTWRAVAREVLAGNALFPGRIERALVPVAGGSAAGEESMAVLQQVDIPSLVVVDDRRFDAATSEQVRELMGEQNEVFLADAVTMTHPEHVILALKPRFMDAESSLGDFRLTPGAVDGVAAMLQVGKLSWEELLEQRHADGVVRREEY